MSAYKILLA